MPQPEHHEALIATNAIKTLMDIFKACPLNGKIQRVIVNIAEIFECSGNNMQEVNIIKNKFIKVCLTITVISLFLLNCSCSGPSNIKANDPTSENISAVNQLAYAIPEDTVSSLYNDPNFFKLRNTIPTETLTRLSAYFSDELIKHLKEHNKAVKKWMKQNGKSNLKLPVSEGPIFLSNYEGADTFHVEKAQIDDHYAKVPVSLSINDFMGEFKWQDIAILKQVDNKWLLDNIIFQPNRGDNYNLRDRVSFSE